MNKNDIGERGAYRLVIGMPLTEFLNNFSHKEINVFSEEKMRETAQAIYTASYRQSLAGRVKRLNPLRWFNEEADKKEEQAFVDQYIKQIKQIRNFYLTQDILPEGISLAQCTFKRDKLYYIFFTVKSEKLWTQWKISLEMMLNQPQEMVNNAAVSYSWRNNGVGIILGRKNDFFMVSYTDLAVLFEGK